MKTSRLIFLLILCFFFLANSTVFPFVITRGPYISSVTKSSIIIRWYTDVNSPSIINYGETSSYGFTLYDSSLMKTHRLTVTNLQPSTVYNYRIRINDSSSSKNFTFKTAPSKDESFMFVAYGDTRTNPEAHLTVVEEIKKINPSFILNVGDLVSNGNKDSTWAYYFKVICDQTEIAASIPIYSALGNHEKESGLYYNYFDLPHNNSENTEAYYSFDYGSAHIICLDTEIPFEKDSKQFLWVNSDLENHKDAKWKFVFLHRPFYSSAGHGENSELRNTYVPLFSKYHVAIVFAGHDHCYERTVPILGVTYVVTGGGGAPLYFVGKNKWTAYSETAYHFCSINVESSKLTVKMIRNNGTVGDTFEILNDERK